jgi:hypothetical protein
MRSYFDRSVTDEQVKSIYQSLMMTGNRIVGPKARQKILNEFTFNPRCVVSYPYKPFDFRWCYLENLRPLFSEPSPELLSQRTAPGNAYFVTRDSADKRHEGSPFYFSRLVCDYDSVSGHARHFPIFVKEKAAKQKERKAGQGDLFLMHIANLSEATRMYLDSLGISNIDIDPEMAGVIWMHALAIGYSSQYLYENHDGVRQGWPRIPLPASQEALLASAALGRRVAALLDVEQPVPGVTAGQIRPELLPIGTTARLGGGGLNPETDLGLTAGWGYAQGSATMPGTGRVVERPFAPGEQASDLLGDYTCDVYLNDVAFWRNVPIRVWVYTIGGYQVIKKWLSYRTSGCWAALSDPKGPRGREHGPCIAGLLPGAELNASYVACKSQTSRRRATASFCQTSPHFAPDVVIQLSNNCSTTPRSTLKPPVNS